MEKIGYNNAPLLTRFGFWLGGLGLTYHETDLKKV